MPIERLKNLHRLSGVILAIFIFLHLINHLFALGGPDAHQQVMRVLRKLYRFPPVEVVILLVAGFQVISGPILAWKSRREKQHYKRLHIASGLYLAFFLFYHIRAILLGRYKWHVETDYHFAAGVVRQAPEKFFFIPYYFLAVLAVFLHVACIHREKMIERWKGSGTAVAVIAQANRQAQLIFLTGVLVAMVIILGLIGIHL